MDTNNLIESWHSTLKRQYITNRKRRADMVVYILTKAVEYDFKIDNFQSFHRIGKMSPTHIHLSSRQRLSDQIHMTIAEDMVNISSTSSFQVQSFTNAPHSYSVNIDINFKMTSCICLDWQQHHLACKHMFLVARIQNNILLPDIINPTVPNENIRRNSTPVDPNYLQRHRNFILRIRRVERGSQRERDNPNMTINIIQELDELGERMETILESINHRRAFIHQEY